MNLNMSGNKVRECAKTQKLTLVEFLDSEGSPGAGFGRNKVTRVHLVFEDGSEARLSLKHYARLADVVFKNNPPGP